MTRLVCALLVACLALPARALDCEPGDDVCALSVAVVRLDADVRLRDARITRLDRELAACRATAAACPEPVVGPTPWALIAATTAGGVVLGLILPRIIDALLPRD